MTLIFCQPPCQPVNSTACADEDTETEADEAGPSQARTRSPKGKTVKKARTQAPLRAPASSAKAPAAAAQDPAFIPSSHEARLPSGTGCASTRHPVPYATGRRRSGHQHLLVVPVQLQSIGLSSMHGGNGNHMPGHEHTPDMPARVWLPRTAWPCKALTWLLAHRLPCLLSPAGSTPACTHAALACLAHLDAPCPDHVSAGPCSKASLPATTQAAAAS